jgi:peptidoglycan/xylan/chitin deacetylase (PgdA/CDA1 family)
MNDEEASERERKGGIGPNDELSRRRLLGAAGALALGSCAGCLGTGPGGAGATGTPTASGATETATSTNTPIDSTAALNDWGRWRAVSGTATGTGKRSFGGTGGSLKLGDVDGSAVRVVNNDVGSLDLSNTSLSAAVKWVKPKGGAAFRLILEDGDGNRLDARTNPPSNGDDGWVECEFGLAEHLDDEPVDLTDVRKLVFVFFNGAEADTEIYIDSITPVTYEATRGAVLFTADDGFETQFTEMQPVLDEYGYPATYLLQSIRVGQDRYMSEAQHRSLVDRGSYVSCHPQRPTSLPTMEDEEQRSIIETEYDYIASQFGDAHARYMSWPYSSRDSTAVADAAEFHDLCFVGTGGAVAGYRNAAPYSVIRCSFDSLSDLTRALDIAERYNRVLIPQFHRFDAERETGGTWIKPEHFESFVADVASRDVDVITPKALLDRRERA